MGFNIFGKKKTPDEILAQGLDLVSKRKYADAMDILLKVKDMPKAMFYIAVCQLNLAHQYPKEMDEYMTCAAKWFEAAGDNGYYEGYYEYAMHLIHYKKNMAEGVEMLKIACNFNVPKAFQSMGMYYVERGDIQTGAEYFKKGAELGYPKCVYNYGVYLLENGHKEESVAWFKRGADMGDPNSMHNYAVHLEDIGRLKEAEKYYKKAADAGLADSMYTLYLYHQYDLGGGIDWLKKSATNGSTKAIAALALKNYTKDKNLDAALTALLPYVQKRDKDVCIALYALLVHTCRNAEAEKIKGTFDAGNAKNIYWIARRLWDLGDVANALTYFRMAANKGDSGSCVRLANYYGNKKDYAEQKKWLEKGVALKDLTAIHNMGVYYLSDAAKYVSDAKEQAVRYLLIALKAGYLGAAPTLKYAIRELKGETVKGFLINTTRNTFFQSLAGGILGDDAADLGNWIDYKLTAILGSVEDTITKAEDLLKNK